MTPASHPSLEAHIVDLTANLILAAEAKILGRAIEGAVRLRFSRLLALMLKPRSGIPVITTNDDRLIELERFSSWCSVSPARRLEVGRANYGSRTARSTSSGAEDPLHQPENRSNTLARSDEPTSDNELFVLLKRKHEESSEPEDLTRYPDRLSLAFMLFDEQPLEIEEDIMFDPHWYCTREKKNP